MLKTNLLFKHLLQGGTIFHFDHRSSSFTTRQTENKFSFALAAPSVPFSFFHLNRVGGRLLLGLLFALFGAMSALAQEPYASLSDDGKTLTFYYDSHKSDHTGTVYSLSWSSSPGWAGTYNSPNKTITKVVFDASFAGYDGLTSAKNMFANMVR